MSLNDEFDAELDDFLGQSQDNKGKPSVVRNMKARNGGVATAKKLLRTPNTGGRDRIAKEVGRPDLSIEALVLKPKYASLFTSAELECARWSLQQIPGGEGEGWRQWVKP